MLHSRSGSNQSVTMEYYGHGLIMIDRTSRKRTLPKLPTPDGFCSSFYSSDLICCIQSVEMKPRTHTVPLSLSGFGQNRPRSLGFTGGLKRERLRCGSSVTLDKVVRDADAPCSCPLATRPRQKSAGRQLIAWHPAQRLHPHLFILLPAS